MPMPPHDETRSKPNDGRISLPSVDLNPIFRRLILAATYQPLVSRPVRKYGMRLGASRFVAGETFDECVAVLRSLNEQGFRTNTTLLGEGVDDATMADEVVESYIAILDRIAAERLNCNVALKLTHLGLDLDEEIGYANVERLVVHAAGVGNFIRIDMEDSPRVDATLRIYRKLRAAGHDNVGTVLQSYLYRTSDDLESLVPLRANLRIVKGAYLEPKSVAYPDKGDVDRQFIALMERMVTELPYTGIATHDDHIIDHMIGYIERRDIPRDCFEFQMLYGIRQQLQRQLVEQGYRVLIATPHGSEWYYYLMRRLAERPANLLFFARNAIRR
jgi:proline dehydrogenase